VLLQGDGADGAGLRVTNGTAAGTSELTGISGVSPKGSSPNGGNGTQSLPPSL